MIILLVTAISLATIYSLVYYFMLVFNLVTPFSRTVFNLSFIIFSAHLISSFFREGLLQSPTKEVKRAITSLKKQVPFLTLVAGIAAVFIFLFTNPFEEFLGGRDPNGYLRTATHIAKYEKIKMSLPILKQAYEEGTHDLLFRTEQWRPDWVGHKGGYFLGSKMTNFGEGEITPQFFHLSPVIASFWIDAFGLEWVGYLIPTLYIMITLLFFAFLRKYISKKSVIPLLGIAVWITSPAILFWSRSFNSESFVFLFILNAMLSGALYLERKKTIFAAFSFVALLAAFLTRGDPIIFLPLAFLIIAFSERKKALLLTLFLSVLFYLGFLAALEDTYPYLSNNFGKILKPIGINQALIYRLKERLPAIVSSFILAAGVLISLTKERLNFAKIKDLLAGVVVKLTPYLIAGAFFLFFLGYEVAQGFDFYSNGANLVKLSWYVGGILGWAVIIGGGFCLAKGLLCSREPVRKDLLLLLFLATCAGLSLFFLVNAHISRDHPWWARKFLVEAIPLLPITFVFLADKIQPQKNLKRLLVGGAFLLIISINTFYARPIISTQQYKGSYTFLEELDSCFEGKQKPVIFFDTSYGRNNFKKRSEYISGYFFGPPLWIFHDRVVYYPKEGAPFEVIVKTAEKHLGKGESVFLVNPTRELLDKAPPVQEVCNLTFSSEMVGWKSVVEPLKLWGDTKLTAESITPINIPLKVFRIKR